jgi:beta-N-acetylhexosaminidase
VGGLLRTELDFGGLVLTDDLLMEGIVARYGLEEAAVWALQAGVDLLLLSRDRLAEDRSSAALVLAALRRALADGRLSPATVEGALGRLDTFRARLP